MPSTMCSGILFICQNNNIIITTVHRCANAVIIFFHHYYGDFRNIIDWIGLPTTREPRIILYCCHIIFFRYHLTCIIARSVSTSVIIALQYIFTSAETLCIYNPDCKLAHFSSPVNSKPFKTLQLLVR